MVEKNGGQFFVVLLPEPRPSPLVTTLLEEEQVPVINLYECFRSLTTTDTDGPWFHLYKFRNDDHWNEQGNHAAVICLYRFLEEKLRLSLLPEDEFQKRLSDYYTAFHAWLPMNVGEAGSLSLRTAARIRAKYAMTDDSLYKKRMKELDEAKENLRAAAAGRHIIASDFDVYLNGRRLVFVKKKYRLSDREASFFLHVIPVDARDLPPDRVPYGFDSLDFNGCTIERRLPSYAIRHIRTGQFTKNAWGEPLTLWESKFSINPDSNRKRRPELVLATGEEIIDHPDLDVSLDGKRLVYVDKDCRPAGREGRFFLHVTPVDPKDLAERRLQHGFDNFDFSPRSSFRIDEFGCRIRKQLPAYPIRHIRTGQFVQDAQGNKRHLWEDEFSMNQGGGGD